MPGQASGGLALSQSVTLSLTPALQLAVDGVGVFAAAPWPVYAVVKVLAGLHTGLGWWVAEQAGKEGRHEAHAEEAGQAAGPGQRARPVGTRIAVIVVVGAVVEKALNQAHASAVFYEVLGRAKALTVAGQA